MTPRFTWSARALCMFVSAASYVATFCGFDDHLDAAEVSGAATSVTVSPNRSIDPPVESVVRRDPFAGAFSSDPGSIVDSAATKSTHDRTTDTDVAVPDIVPRYADQITFDESTKAEPPALFLRATITGSRPVAYVEDGNNLEIVRISDPVGGRRVATIDLRGLSFTDGTRLDLPGAFTPTPAPHRLADSNRSAYLTKEFQRLRKLLLSRMNAAAKVPRVAGQASSDTTVTPGPLRTVDPNGRPVGTTPTPDADAPTAFPVPYPYPPRPR